MNINSIIHCYRYRDELCDYIYEGQDDLPSGRVSVDIQKCPEFFQKINSNGHKYTVVSCASDFMLCEQKQYPVWMDIPKGIRMFGESEHGYWKETVFPARCDLNKCKIDDRYSIKCYMWTSHTFNEIPDNVKRWYLTNSAIKHERIVNLPFGVQSIKSAERIVEAKSSNKLRVRDKGIFACWQFYTVERANLFQHLSTMDYPFITLKKDIPQEEFYENLCTHKYVFCPVGNGPDCYRIYEALYLGCIPIIEYHPALTFLRSKLNLPVIFVNHEYMYNPRMHELEVEEQRLLYEFHSDFSLQKLQWEYWHDKITEK